MKKYSMFLVIVLAGLFTIPCSAANTALDDLNIHGFVSQGFLYTTKNMQFLTKDAEDGTFEFNEMAVNFSVNPTDNLNLGMQLNAFDLGAIGNDNVEIDWAFGDYSFRDYLGVRAGIMKVPFGLYNEVRKIDMVRSSILLPTSVYPEWFRETFARIKGVGLYGVLPGNISFQFMYGNFDVNKDSGLADGIETLQSALGMDVTGIDTNFAYSGKLQWNSAFGLKLAASLHVMDGLKAEMGNNLNLPAMVTGGLAGLTTPLTALSTYEPITSYVFSAEYMTDRLTLMCEYVEYDIELTMTISSTLDPAVVAAMGIPTRMEEENTMQGYYGGIAYRVLDQFEIGTYYSVLYYDKSDHGGKAFSSKFGKPDYNAYLKDFCLSARYDFSSSWCGKIEGHLMDGAFMAYNAAAENWALYAAKVTYSF